VPARKGSRGCPGKNLRTLGGKTLIEHAIDCAWHIDDSVRPVLTTDIDEAVYRAKVAPIGGSWHVGGLIRRGPGLAADDTPMLSVVQDALLAFPGEPDDVICILQPTQPLRRPEHIQQAIALLRESQADSVVSVVPLPLTHSPEMACYVEYGRLHRAMHNSSSWAPWTEPPTRRQDARQAYIRDGTVYAFWRKTVDQHGTIYGQDVRPLIIDPADSCELDTEADWAALEQRWRERHEAGQR
jgi:CMP-N-acetylneuraminic acid synthetase